MPRRELIGLLGLGGIVLIAAILALRFDLASMLLPDGASRLNLKRSSEAKVATAPAKATTVTVPATATEAPPSTSFDVVRIDPQGASVFAGRAPANAQVTVLADNKPVASAKANEDGQWATVIERKFGSGEHELSLQAKPNGPGAVEPGQSVRITVAASAPPPPAKAAPLAEPRPITFAYDEAALTSAGRREALALGEYVRQRRLDSVTLSGHADERGSDYYNMELSRQRLETVAHILRESGYSGRLVLVPKGKREPFAAEGRDRLPTEEAFQLDRRVQLRLAP